MERHALKTWIALAMLIFLIATACATEELRTALTSPSSVAVLPGGEMAFLPVPTLAAGSDPAGNFTKLEVIPSNMHFSLKPGETNEQTVMVRNRDSKTAIIQPAVKSIPYSGLYTMDSSWVAITPVNAEVPAGGSAKFTVTASVPSDALRGSYSTLVAFTDEVYPSPYSTPFLNYVHMMNLAVDVTSPPAIQISTPYISDQMEAGKEYHYAVNLKNNGKNPLMLNAKIGSDSYPMYGPSGQQEPVLTDSAFTLDAPTTIPPGATVPLNIDVRVPPDATGYYYGYIDLGIDDPSIHEGEGRIQLTFMVWKQPREPFEKTFSMTGEESIAIELTSGALGVMPMTSSKVLPSIPVKEPAFETTLTGPEGNVEMTQTQKVIKGMVMLTSDPSSGILPATNGYQDTGAQYTYTYTAQGKSGQWKLAVMPRNTQGFEYKISLGSDISDRLNCLKPSLGVTPDASKSTGNSSPVGTPVLVRAVVNGTS